MIGILTAYDRNKSISKNRKIPWEILDSEFKLFSELTSGHIIVMGEEFFKKEIKQPIIGRINVIISENLDTINNSEDFYIFQSIDEFMKEYRLANSIKRFNSKYKNSFKGKSIYAIGGEEIFISFLDIADIIYATEIDFDYKGTEFFPNFKDRFKNSDYREAVKEEKTKDGFVVYTHKRYVRR